MNPDARDSPVARPSPWAIAAAGLAAAFLLHHLFLEWGRLADFNPPPNLTIFEQSLWNTLHGRFMANGAEGNHFGVNFQPALLLFLPLYAIHQTPEFLVGLSLAVIAASALAVFRFARRETGSDPLAFVAAAAYLAHPATHGLAQAGFDPIVLAIPVLLFLIDALRRDRTGRAVFWTVLLLTIRQDMPLILVPLGAWAFLMRRRKAAAIAVALGAAWFALAVYVVIPAFRGESPEAYYLMRFPPEFGSTIADAANYCLTHPLAVLGRAISSVVRGSVGPGLLLSFPLALPGLDVLAVGVPWLLVQFTARFFLHHSIYGHYHAPLIALLFAATAIGAGRIGRRSRKAAAALLAALLAFSIAATWKLGALSGNPRGTDSPLYASRPLDAKQRALVADVAATIGPDASLAVSSNLAFRFARHRNARFPLYDPDAIGSATYILVDTRLPLPMSEADAERFQGRLARDYRIRREAGGIVVFEKIREVNNRAVPRPTAERPRAGRPPAGGR